MKVNLLLKEIRQRKFVLKMCKLIDSLCDIVEQESDYILNAFQQAETKYGYNEEVFNKITISVFIKFSIKDILVLYKLFLRSKNEQEKNLIARTIAMHLFEFINDVGKLIGKPLGSLIIDFEDDLSLNKKLKNVRNVYNEIKEIYDEMKIIRNYVSAHKGRDVRKQLKITNKIALEDFHLFIVKIEFFILAFSEFERAIVKKIIAIQERLDVS